MYSKLYFRRSTWLILIIFSGIFSLTECINKEDNKQSSIPPGYNQFAGSASCASCHKDIYQHHIHTAHFITSQPANRSTVEGSADTVKNIYYFNPSLYVAVEKADTSLYQVAYLNKERKLAHRMDIVIGSGVKGQSYVYWQRSFLYQMPLTYYSFAHQWGNSPGYPNKVQFNRPITSRCLECHTTFAERIKDAEEDQEKFNSQRIIYGVDCEKCHGPGLKHVEFQTNNPNEKQGKFIINPATFTRQQKLDLCTLCHGGRMTKTKPSFSFVSGNSLSDYFDVDTSQRTVDYRNIDVHGNQYGLLRASKCFRFTNTLTCNTCHNSHENERGNITLFSQRCMNCHNEQHKNFCTFKTTAISIKNNCIDCHMPSMPSKAIIIVSPEQNRVMAAQFRSHYIAIYKDETNKFLQKNKK
ncbi:MAG: cytochrome c3 family protein [Flavisolibacter sp.]